MARAGLLQDYDPVNAAMAQIDSAVARLRSEALKDGLDAAPVDRLAAASRQEDELTERFKTDNALLRNSLSYVGLLSTNPDFVERNPLLAKPIGALAAAILQLTLNSSAPSRQAVQDSLAELAEQTPVEGPDEGPAQAFIAHARLLENLLPSGDDTVKALFAVPTRPPLEETHALFSDRHTAAEASAQRFRLLLYATSLLLLVALIDLGRRLRARAVALQKRAAFEHLIAEGSTRLINCPPGETESRARSSARRAGEGDGRQSRLCGPRRDSRSGSTPGPSTARRFPQDGRRRRWRCPSNSRRSDSASSPCGMSPCCPRAPPRRRS